MGNTTDAVSPPVVTVLVFVNVITKMDNIVDRVFSSRVSICVEEAEWIVAAGIHCYLDGSIDFVALAGDGLRSTERAGVVGVADVELIVCNSG